jgi:hypothetical protein
MNLTEVKQLLTEVAAIDNRKLSDQTADAWHSVLGFMPFDIAKEALHIARKDDRINWMEPKNIVSWAKEAAFKLDRAKPVVIEQIKGSQQPLCAAHSALLLTCIPCCKQMYADESAEVTQSNLELALTT